MSKHKRSSGGRSNAAFLRHQAEAQKAAKAALLARQTDRDVQQQQAKDMLQKLVTQTMTMQQRVARLAVGFADRCYRVHELMGLYRAEWERAERLAAENDELRRQLEHGAAVEEPDTQQPGRHAARVSGNGHFTADSPRIVS